MTGDEPNPYAVPPPGTRSAEPARGYPPPASSLPAPPAYGQPSGYGYAAAPSMSPRELLMTAASRASASAVLLFVLVPAWLAIAVGGGLLLGAKSTLDDGDVGSALDASDNSDAALGLGLIALIAVGAAIWALMALWTSWSARAARSIGRERDVTLSHAGWWGVFVPLGNLVLGYLAYQQAARFTDSARTRRPGRLSLLLLLWHVAAMGALTLIFTGLGVSSDTEFSVLDSRADAVATLYVCAGLLGAGSAVLGGIAMLQISRAARATTQS